MTSILETALRTLGFHPLAAAEFKVVREVLKRDDRFRLSHLSPLVLSFAFTQLRRPWIKKAKLDAAAVPEDWHRRTPPIFVLGFWRSGTTLLHELLAADPDLAAPSLVDVLCPADAPYLLKWKRELVSAVAPPTRGIDDVQVAPKTVQEEELALCNLGAPAFFGVSFFPRQRDALIDEALFFEGSPSARARWREDHMRFSRMLVAKYPGRRLVLKNPANCTRIPDLLEMYPDATFIRIDRDADQVVSSFLRMQAQGDRKFSLQGLSPPPQREAAVRFRSRVIERLDRDWELIPDDRKTRVHYDELTRDPILAVNHMLRDLGIPITPLALRSRWRYWRKRGQHRTPSSQKS